ncbi:type I restriction endonuclease subunit R [Spongiimicrobium salis]|uniref:type I restriction endonuclease subunit R n=1 Tax=Spongiimicrobium salis TaxID=1667022 RepID=UPI00374CACE9
MTTQTEQILENNLVAQLESLGYDRAIIKDESDLYSNLKGQLEKHNKVALSDKEFEQVLNHLNRGNVFERAKILRDKFQYTKDDGSAGYLEFLDQVHWCKNQFQVTQQVSIEGSYKNRYDVTILINGLPLVQIELKRRGLELKEAFNQINRYQRHSFWAASGLFQYVQLFVISNGVNTKYYANNRKQEFKQTFFWADKFNKKITQLSEFTDTFLEKCHLSKMITKYIVLAETHKVLMVLRPYQYYATEAIINQVKNSVHNGYIWHTTGSGKTLTSFKASQVLKDLPKVDKVVFVVDRKDLDYQTTKEFNSFSKGSIDGTDNTSILVQQFTNTYKDDKGEIKNTKLIVTTIQKLNNAISKSRYKTKMESVKDSNIVFIFDECHRSQFGRTHKEITEFFSNSQMFGFTGTPILVENAASNSEFGKRTTKDLFGECLHKYVITDAIRDENVLKFSIEYINTIKQKDGVEDIDVEAIDEKEVMDSPKRIEAVVDYIIKHHPRKTHQKKFSAMFCVSSVDALTTYYDIFKKKREAGEHNLRLATIFSYVANENDSDANGYIEADLPVAAEPQASYGNSHTRDKLESYIGDYNTQYKTKFTTKDSQSFYNYYKDIAKRIKDREREDFKDVNRVDVLLVVNMFLTGFDAKKVNTLYVDKNLRYHGLIQAFSRTNRILGEEKSQGNIVAFRNLKARTDEAITLFSNKDANEDIILEPYEDYVQKFNLAFAKLLGIAPTVQSVDNLQSEDDELDFVKAFRELIRIKNVLQSFTDFTFDDIALDEQTFEDYKSKYLDIHDKVRNDNAVYKESILNDVDFELELIRRDEVNVAYILELLAGMKDTTTEEKTKKEKAINDLLEGEAHLRSKRELIERFIQEQMPLIADAKDIPAVFATYWTAERKKALVAMCASESLVPEKLEEVISDYLFTEKEPLRDDVLGALEKKPSILQRKTVYERILGKITKFVETYITGLPEAA